MILGTSRAVRVFAFPEPVDLRKGFDGLFGLVRQCLGRDPLSGDLFLFVNKRRAGCKVLVWDRMGLCIFQVRSQRTLGSFAGGGPTRSARRRGAVPTATRGRIRSGSDRRVRRIHHPGLCWVPR